MLKDSYGAWELQDAKGKRPCCVMLKSESAISGSRIDVALPRQAVRLPNLRENAQSD